MSGQEIILNLKKDYVQRKGLFYLLLLFSFSLLFGSVYLRWTVGTAATCIISGFWLIGCMLLYREFQKVKETSLHSISRYLNRTETKLEESSHLVLQPTDKLNPLEKLQVNRITPTLSTLNAREAIPVSYRPALIIFGSSVLLSALMLFLPGPKVAQPEVSIKAPFSQKQLQAIQQVVPEIKEITIQVTPPAYTRRAPYSVQNPSFKAEAGARLTWRIQTAGEIKDIRLSVQEKKNLNFRKVANAPHTYEATFTPATSFIYTLDLNGKKSDFYAVEIIPDQAPSITITQPKQYTQLTFGQPQQVTVLATLSDDYGLHKATLTATVAKGSGESVKFSEKTFPLILQPAGTTGKWTVRQKLDLKAMGMTYADELYFFLQAQDNHRNSARSETYLVQLEDTTVITAGADVSLPLSVVPAYFRSQRQLIIDTEKLLQEKNKLSPEAFRERSNDLAGEQKILRLRYGKFLGEESSTTIGPNGKEPEEHSADDGHDHTSTPETQNSAAELLDPYLHKHDTEEDATFFEPQVKAQLKAALSQMWEAELQLRLSLPAKALPFEYKALRLLKEVQQKSRVYVRKMGFDPPLIIEKEKRLSGELDKIAAPTNQAEQKEKQNYPAIRQALLWLGQQTPGQPATTPDALVLQRGGQELARVAANKPGQYLKGLQDLRQLIRETQAGKSLCSSCLSSVTGVMERVLPAPLPAPAAPTRYRHALAEQYFKRLK
ncbi:DUF4175 family protein [Adhaeribacter rhizoryzae]|uniref:DUF4175 domain-containing protein n=1 Tax=Adhaeribacter rhizoryzae TaxID=2607907 RepID=A0A5M6CX68_9BACT|nr:DUF4175 family protein [Adhaeribacter rhizoryzae]KAA5539828.1 DUF4175 domain-containing protein [Adhaeribacter rhizoryzae]